LEQNKHITGEQILYEIEDSFSDGEEFTSWIEYKGERIPMDDISIIMSPNEVYSQPEDLWEKADESCIDTVYADTKDSLVSVTVQSCSDGDHSYFDVVVAAEDDTEFMSYSMKRGDWKESLELETTISEEYLTVDLVEDGKVVMFVQVKYQDGADVFVDIFREKNSQPIESSYITKEEVYEANGMKVDADICKCGNCGAVSWNDFGGECDSCDASDPTDIIGREVDINEETTEDKLRDWANEKLGWCKLKVTAIDKVHGILYVSSRDETVKGFGIHVKDIA